MGPVRKPAPLQHCHHHQELGCSNIFSSFSSQQSCGEGSRENKGSCSNVESGNVRSTHPTPTGVRGRRVVQDLQKFFALFVSISAVRRLGSDQRMSPQQANVALVEIPSLGNPILGRDGSRPPWHRSVLHSPPLHPSLVNAGAKPLPKGPSQGQEVHTYPVPLISPRSPTLPAPSSSEMPKTKLMQIWN